MCGIAGLIAWKSGAVDPSLVAGMGESIAHRGPDDDGVWVDGAVGFAFRRLAILDLSPSGHQPMASDDGQLVLVFNGEIYNYRELRAELEGLGHRFRSTSDTEVLLRAYQQWGTDCVSRFNGMWGFLIHDRRRGVVFGSRDRFGVKPMYWAETADGIAIASEIKAVRVAGAGASPDWSRISEWLVGPSLDSIPARGRTFFAGVREVLPATAFEVSLDGRVREWTYWSLDGIERREHPDPVGAFGELFDDAIKLQARADVPVGVSLSGGLDSTLITCQLARETGATLDAFCYMSAEHDERPYIEATLAESGARLNVVAVDPRTLFAKIDDLLVVHDEPVHTLNAAIGSEIMAAARARGVKVMLSGQGADELLGGYSSYFDEYWMGLALRGDGRWEQELDEWAAVHGGDRSARAASIRRRVRLARLAGAVPFYRRLTGAHRRRAASRHPWYTDALTGALPLPMSAGGVGLTAALRRSVAHTTLPLYLRIEDRNSMAHGVEGRVPFLDHRLAELAFGLPEHWLIRGPWNKYVQRQAMNGRVPEVVHRRPDKMGFAHPQRTWFQQALAEPLLEMLARPTLPELLNAECVRSDLTRHQRGEVDCSNELFRFAQLERWLKLVAPVPARVRGPVDSRPASLAGTGGRPGGALTTESFE